MPGSESDQRDKLSWRTDSTDVCTPRLELAVERRREGRQRVLRCVVRSEERRGRVPAHRAHRDDPAALLVGAYAGQKGAQDVEQAEAALIRGAGLGDGHVRVEQRPQLFVRRLLDRSDEPIA